MRLAKYLAQAGIASRRQAEDFIAAGRIKVNGAVVTDLARQVNEQTDRIEFDDRPAEIEEPVYILLNKPSGYLSTVTDPRGRPTVRQLVSNIKARIYPVGRLDYDTAGLLLLTNDGDFTNLIIHPRYKIAKKYEVNIAGRIKAAELKKLREGVLLEDGITAPAQANIVKSGPDGSLIELVIHEGRKRQVKRMMAAVGHPLLSLARTGLGFLDLTGVEPGHFRYLTQEEVDGLRKMALQGTKSVRSTNSP